MASATTFAARGIRDALSWRAVFLDTLLAWGGMLGVTAVIAGLHLYPRVPNISILYLLVVLLLASVRGRYASILASLVAFFAFNFFIIPPIYTFIVYQPGEWIALFIFLITAILTSQLAVMLRDRAEIARRREQETQILYRLVRVTNSEDQPERQLQLLAKTLEEIYTPWGVTDCAILQPEDVKQPVEPSTEQTETRSALSDDSSVHLVPLLIGQRLVGYWKIDYAADQHQVRRFGGLRLWGQAEGVPALERPFYDILLGQVAALVEQVRLRNDEIRMELLQRTDELRTALLMSVSHDLRTPLTAIKAAASSLLQDDVNWDSVACHGFTFSIEREADRLNRLVGNLLDMSRIEGGELRPAKEVYPLTVLVRDVVSRLRTQIGERPFNLSLPDDLVTVECDYVQIDQVLTNLLENALRYTPPASPIDVTLSIEERSALLRVADRGPGIPQADMAHIFDKFYRVLTRQPQEGFHAGSGLGLAICKGIVEAHGGKIWAEARVGGGVVFLVLLPLEEVERSVA